MGLVFHQVIKSHPLKTWPMIYLTCKILCSHCRFAWKSWKGLQPSFLRFPPPAAPNPGSAPGPDFSSPVPAYGCPAVTAIPNHLSIPALDLANKHILWTPITSAGVSLPLPIDSCCSLSLFSKAHADVIAQKHPHLTFTKLQNSLPVAVANPSSQLKAIDLMEVPIIWENGRPSIFCMLVVPGLAWPILFGQNHLSKPKAHTDHSGLTVHLLTHQWILL